MGTYQKNERLPFPYEINDIDSELSSQLLKDFSGERTGYVQVGPEKWFLPSKYRQYAEDIYNFEFRPSDVVIVTFPRSGSTVAQEMIWLLCNNLNYQEASELTVNTRFPHIEGSVVIHNDVKQEIIEGLSVSPDMQKRMENMDYPVWKRLDEVQEKRFIRTHLPFSLLPPNLTAVGCKIVYPIRDPRDVAVSFYHLNRSLKTFGYTGDFKKFWDYFQRNLVKWSPFLEHIKEGWMKRFEENVLIVFYDDLIKDMRGSIEKVAKFLDKSYTPEEFDKLANHLKFENFKNNKSVNGDRQRNLGFYTKNESPFIRKGISGGWKEYFDEEMEKGANEWIENSLKDTGLQFS